MSLFPRRISVTVLVLAAFLGGVAVGRLELRKPSPRPATSGRSPANPGNLPAPLDAERIREVWNVLHDKFSGELDDEKLSRGALRGIVSGTGDPYTAYADPMESKQFSDELEGSFSGIGIEIGLRRGLVTVIAPLRKSPAERAGVRARDVIVKVDGQEINHKISLGEVVAKIRGRAGTTVHLTAAREGAGEFLEFDIRRERIAIESVELTLRDDIALLTISAFNEDTSRRMDRAARELLAKGAKGIILDLRNNPGGLLEVSVDVAGHFLPRGTLVVSEVPKAAAQRTEHRAEGPSDLQSLPLVVLVNGGSASASEILAAALHEQRQAPLVGEDTFGKGSVQELAELSDKGTIRVTVARWDTSKGTEIGEDGIKATVEVKDEKPEEDPDAVLDKGMEILRQNLSDGRR